MAESPDNLTDTTAHPPAPAEKTRGDKLFDRTVYGLLNGVGTFIVTLPLAYWAKHGDGAKLFEKAGAALTKIHVPENIAAEAVRTTALGLGGTVMVAPVRLAEANRTGIVNDLNQRYGNETDKKNTNVPSAPPQTWGSLLRGRALAWTTVFASFMGVGAISKAVGHPKALADFENKVGDKAVSLFGKYAKTPQATERLHRYGELAALDVFATTAATILLYTGSRFFAKNHEAAKARQRAHANAGDDLSTLPTVLSMADQAPQATAEQETTLPTTTISGDKLQAGLVQNVPEKETAPQRA